MKTNLIRPPGLLHWVCLMPAAAPWLVFLNAAPHAHGAPAVANSECLECHAADESAPATGGVRPGSFAKSVHSEMACVDCHDSIKEASHDTPLPKVQCATCHADTGATHPFHARLSLTSVPAGTDTSCAECHGTHETVALKSEAFPFAPAAQAASCGRCHESAPDGWTTWDNEVADTPSCQIDNSKLDSKRA